MAAGPPRPALGGLLRPPSPSRKRVARNCHAGRVTGPVVTCLLLALCLGTRYTIAANAAANDAEFRAALLNESATVVLLTADIAIEASSELWPPRPAIPISRHLVIRGYTAAAAGNASPPPAAGARGMATAPPVLRLPLLTLNGVTGLLRLAAPNASLTLRDLRLATSQPLGDPDLLPGASLLRALLAPNFLKGDSVRLVAVNVLNCVEQANVGLPQAQALASLFALPRPPLAVARAAASAAAAAGGAGAWAALPLLTAAADGSTTPSISAVSNKLCVAGIAGGGTTSRRALLHGARSNLLSMPPALSALLGATWRLLWGVAWACGIAEPAAPAVLAAGGELEAGRAAGGGGGGAAYRLLAATDDPQCLAGAVKMASLAAALRMTQPAGGGGGGGAAVDLAPAAAADIDATAVDVLAVVAVIVINTYSSSLVQVEPACLDELGEAACVAAAAARLDGSTTSSSASSAGGGGGGTSSTAFVATLAALLPACVLLAACLGAALWVLWRIHRRQRRQRGAQLAPGVGPLTTLCLTDIANSTALWEALADEVMNRALQLHHSCLRALVARFKGYESATEGDSFILAFHTPLDAAKFALCAQMQLMEVVWPPEVLSHPDGSELWLEMRSFDPLNTAPDCTGYGYAIGSGRHTAVGLMPDAPPSSSYHRGNASRGSGGGMYNTAASGAYFGPEASAGRRASWTSLGKALRSGSAAQGLAGVARTAELDRIMLAAELDAEAPYGVYGSGGRTASRTAVQSFSSRVSTMLGFNALVSGANAVGANANASGGGGKASDSGSNVAGGGNVASRVRQLMAAVGGGGGGGGGGAEPQRRLRGAAHARSGTTTGHLDAGGGGMLRGMSSFRGRANRPSMLEMELTAPDRARSKSFMVVRARTAIPDVDNTHRGVGGGGGGCILSPDAASCTADADADADADGDADAGADAATAAEAASHAGPTAAILAAAGGGFSSPRSLLRQALSIGRRKVSFRGVERVAVSAAAAPTSGGGGGGVTTDSSSPSPGSTRDAENASAPITAGQARSGFSSGLRSVQLLIEDVGAASGSGPHGEPGGGGSSTLPNIFNSPRTRMGLMKATGGGSTSGSLSSVRQLPPRGLHGDTSPGYAQPPAAHGHTHTQQDEGGSVRAGRGHQAPAVSGVRPVSADSGSLALVTANMSTRSRTSGASGSYGGDRALSGINCMFDAVSSAASTSSQLLFPMPGSAAPRGPPTKSAPGAEGVTNAATTSSRPAELPAALTGITASAPAAMSATEGQPAEVAEAEADASAPAPLAALLALTPSQRARLRRSSAPAVSSSGAAATAEEAEAGAGAASSPVSPVHGQTGSAAGLDLSAADALAQAALLPPPPLVTAPVRPLPLPPALSRGGSSNGPQFGEAALAALEALAPLLTLPPGAADAGLGPAEPSLAFGSFQVDHHTAEHHSGSDAPVTAANAASSLVGSPGGLPLLSAARPGSSGTPQARSPASPSTLASPAGALAAALAAAPSGGGAGGEPNSWLSSMTRMLKGRSARRVGLSARGSPPEARRASSLQAPEGVYMAAQGGPRRAGGDAKPFRGAHVAALAEGELGASGSGGDSSDMPASTPRTAAGGAAVAGVRVGGGTAASPSSMLGTRSPSHSMSASRSASQNMLRGLSKANLYVRSVMQSGSRASGRPGSSANVGGSGVSAPLGAADGAGGDSDGTFAMAALLGRDVDTGVELSAVGILGSSSGALRKLAGQHGHRSRGGYATGNGSAGEHGLTEELHGLTLTRMDEPTSGTGIGTLPPTLTASAVATAAGGIASGGMLQGLLGADPSPAGAYMQAAPAAAASRPSFLGLRRLHSRAFDTHGNLLEVMGPASARPNSTDVIGLVGPLAGPSGVGTMLALTAQQPLPESRPWREQCRDEWQLAMRPAPPARCAYRGLRVRIGLHTGIFDAADVSFNPTTSHMAYGGTAMKIAKAVGDAAAGGMILISHSTFRAITTQLADLPGTPQAIFSGESDLGLGLGPADGGDSAAAAASESGRHGLYQLVQRELVLRIGYAVPLRNIALSQLGTEDAPTGVVAIAFCHVSSASMLVAELGQPGVEALHQFKSITTDLCGSCGGYVVEASEGLCLAAFRHAAAALVWALAASEALTAYSWSQEVRRWYRTSTAIDPTPAAPNGGGGEGAGASSPASGAAWGRGPRPRTGVHVGGVAVEVNSTTGRMTYRGKVMNRTSRIAHKAASGQIVCSKEAWDAVEGSVAALARKIEEEDVAAAEAARRRADEAAAAVEDALVTNACTAATTYSCSNGDSDSGSNGLARRVLRDVGGTLGSAGGRGGGSTGGRGRGGGGGSTGGGARRLLSSILSVPATFSPPAARPGGANVGAAGGAGQPAPAPAGASLGGGVDGANGARSSGGGNASVRAREGLAEAQKSRSEFRRKPGLASSHSLAAAVAAAAPSTTTPAPLQHVRRPARRSASFSQALAHRSKTPSDAATEASPLRRLATLASGDLRATSPVAATAPAVAVTPAVTSRVLAPSTLARTSSPYARAAAALRAVAASALGSSGSGESTISPPTTSFPATHTTLGPRSPKPPAAVPGVQPHAPPTSHDAAERSAVPAAVVAAAARAAADAEAAAAAAEAAVAAPETSRHWRALQRLAGLKAPLPAGKRLGARLLGSYSLKGVKEEMRLYEVSWTSEEDAAALTPRSVAAAAADAAAASAARAITTDTDDTGAIVSGNTPRAEDSRLVRTASLTAAAAAVALARGARSKRSGPQSEAALPTLQIVKLDVSSHRAASGATVGTGTAQSVNVLRAGSLPAFNPAATFEAATPRSWLAGVAPAPGAVAGGKRSGSGHGSRPRSGRVDSGVAGGGGGPSSHATSTRSNEDSGGMQHLDLLQAACSRGLPNSGQPRGLAQHKPPATAQQLAAQHGSLTPRNGGGGSGGRPDYRYASSLGSQASSTLVRPLALPPFAAAVAAATDTGLGAAGGGHVIDGGSASPVSAAALTSCGP